MAKEYNFNDRERDKYLGGWLAAAIMVGQVVGSSGAGYLEGSSGNRKNMCLWLIVVSGASTTSYIFMPSFFFLTVLRFILGVCQGACIPVVYSVAADYYNAFERPGASAALSGAVGAGTLIGQLFAGYTAYALSWQKQAFWLGSSSLFFFVPFYFIFQEPSRGLSDLQSIKDIENNGPQMIGEKRDSDLVDKDKRDGIEVKPFSSEESGKAHESICSEAASMTNPNSSTTNPCGKNGEVLGGSNLSIDAEKAPGANAIPALSWQVLLNSCSVPTVALMLLQALPNTVPWGILTVHFHDYLIHDVGLTIATATSMIGCFGIGAAIGGIGGGFVGGYLYRMDKRYMTIFIAITTIVGGFFTQNLLNSSFLLALKTQTEKVGAGSEDTSGKKTSLETFNSIHVVVTLMITAGTLSSVNSANIRAILLNMAVPEARGAIIGFSNLLNCVGRGIGPILAIWYMNWLDLDRAEGLSHFVLLWVVAGVILALATFTIVADEKKIAALIRRYEASSPHTSR
jgi:MFS family permease